MQRILESRESDVCNVRLNPETMKWDPNEPISKMYIFGTVIEIAKLSDGKLHGIEVRHHGSEPTRIVLDLTDEDLLDYIHMKLDLGPRRKEPK